MDEMLRDSLTYISRGLSVVPVLTNGPIERWQAYISSRPTEQRVHAWFTGYGNSIIGLALVLGPATWEQETNRYLWVLRITPNYRTEAERWLDTHLSMWRGCSVVESPSGSLYVYCCAPQPVSTRSCRWGTICGEGSYVPLPHLRAKVAYRWLACGPYLTLAPETLYLPGLAVVTSNSTGAAQSSTPLQGGATVALQPVRLATLPLPAPQRWPVPGIIAGGFPSIVYGQGGSCKSYVALAIGICLASGTPWLGQRVEKRPVLYLDFELDQSAQHGRALAISRGLGLDRIPAALDYFALAGYRYYDIEAAVYDWVTLNPGGIVILDSVGFALDTDSRDERAVNDLFRALRSLDAGGVLLVDTESKPGQSWGRPSQVYGSVYKMLQARVIWHLRIIGREPNTLRVEMRLDKSNFTAAGEKRHLEVAFSGSDTITFSGLAMPEKPINSGNTLELRVQRALLKMGQATIDAVAAELSAKPDSVKTTLSRMVTGGRAEVAGREGRKRVYTLIRDSESISDGQSAAGDATATTALDLS